jgi:hypothetical protein
MAASPPPYRRSTATGSEAAAAEVPPAGGIPKWTLLPLAALLVAGIMAIVAGNETANVFLICAHALVLLPVLLAAWMLGLALTAPLARRGLFADSPWPDAFRSVVAVALGLGCFSLAVLLIGMAGLLNRGEPFVTLGLLLAAGAIGFFPTRTFLDTSDRTLLRTKTHRGDLLLLLAVVPVAMLLVAATFPPGTLWRTEARGYDVMEYHLQLPREYTESGSAMPVAHNVYSFFPANVEMNYVLLTQLAKIVMRDDSHLWGTFPAQFFHVTLMLLTAAAIALAPSPRRAAGNGPATLKATGATGRAAAVLLFLGVPWTIVTGSLAYNEGGMLLYGTLALVLALAPPLHTPAAHPTEPDTVPGPPAPPALARGLLIGALLGLAVGCKLTAGLFFAVPVAAILLLRAINAAHLLKTLAVATVVALAVFSLWALRGALASGGNPVFPFFASILGRDGWTPDEIAKFEAGHGTPANIHGLAARATALVRNSVTDAQWSPSWRSIDTWARNPPADNVRWKRIGLLWLILPLGIALAFAATATRPGATLLLVVLAIQLLAWMFFTHLQARFLLPVAIPLALLMMFAAQGRGTAEALIVGGLRVVVATALGVHALCTIFLLLPEAGLLGGTANLAAGGGGGGGGPPPQPIGQLFENQVNVALLARPDLLHGGPLDPASIPDPETVLLVGDATAWRYAGRADQVRYSTVFNRNLLSAVLAEPAPPARLALLHKEGIRFILINWSEIDRLRRTYGFDPAITPDAVKTLAAAGLKEIPTDAPGLTLLEVPK